MVFEQGSLAEALRSTMSIPGAFCAVVDKDRVLVDGGLVNNLPTDVVKQAIPLAVEVTHVEHEVGSKRARKSGVYSNKNHPRIQRLSQST